MNRTTWLMLAIAACGAIPALAASPSDLGPRPDWTRYKALGEAAVRAQLTDPQNWSFEWPNGYADLGTRADSPWHGWTTCALMRVATPVPGRSPVTQFIVVIDHDQVRNLKISGNRPNTMVTIACGQAVRTGRLPPASLMAAGSAASDATAAATAPVSITSLGLSIRPVAEGGYVTAVAAGSHASTAGMLPGMVISEVNGIALTGMGQAMTHILAADQSRLDIKVATGQHFMVSPTKSGTPTP